MFSDNMNDKTLPTKEYSVSVRDAVFPKPFYQGLEFNAPAHGNWNIVHIGMLLPEARQIYVCADNCMRGVVLTAAEMNAEDRFSFVLLDEADMTVGNLEDVTIKGVAACIDKLDSHPPVILLFTVCVHHFLGCDLDYVYRKLGERYPDIFFARCYMDPLLQKTRPTPDQKLRLAMYEPLKALPVNKHTISLIGSELPLHKSSDLYKLIELVSGSRASNAIKLKEISSCTSYKEYLTMGESALFIADFPGALMGLEALGKRLERPYLYLPMSFSYDEIKGLWSSFAQALYSYCIKGSKANAKCTLPDHIQKLILTDIENQKALCENALSSLRSLIGDTEIRIDYVFHPRPLGLARLLLEHGFNVSTVYIDVISAEEEADLDWLKQNAPDMLLSSTVQVEARIRNRNRPDVLAIGQKAAWFSGTAHFVNAVYGAGLWGFDGILRLCELMEQAYREEKDTKDLITRKGWGCASCV